MTKKIQISLTKDKVYFLLDELIYSQFHGTPINEAAKKFHKERQELIDEINAAVPDYSYWRKNK